jgi:hypothetical protein
MAKSVFISSTSMDLKEHREAVNAAVRRLELRPIDLVDNGSQPGGASVSASRKSQGRHFHRPHARRYGYVPDGMTTLSPSGNTMSRPPPIRA